MRRLGSRPDWKNSVTPEQACAALNHVWLMPHNVAYAPISGDDPIILGKIVSVLRKVER